jgi:DNA-directed RNA polymerase
MDTYELPLEHQMALEKADRNNERAIRQSGYGASDLGLHLTQKYLRAVSEYIENDLKELDKNAAVNDAKIVIGQLRPEVIALSGLNAVLNGVARGGYLTELCQQVGKSISAECWAAGLTQHDPKLAARVARAARKKHFRTSYRRQAARGIANRAGYTVDHWSSERLITAGSWLLDCVTTACEGVFELRQGPDSRISVTLAPGALEAAKAAVDEALANYVVFLPSKVEPHPWTGWWMVNADPRVAFERSFIRTFHKDTTAACKAAIANGSMKPALDAVSSLQGVPWRINQKIFEVLQECLARNIDCKSLPKPVDIPKPEKKKPWAEMSNQEQTLWKIEADEAEADNRATRNQRLLMHMDMRIASMLGAERFWTAMNCDWRGRVYSLTHFNFQREDRVRALFEFADGMEIGEEGLRYLQLHVANCGDFDKISKQPVEERIQWTQQNVETLIGYAELPLKELGWCNADKPFLFLAGCMELAAALRCGPSYVTRLPVSFDGSCSGLQHLSAMTRDADTASLVNLTVGAKPNDVYAVIADELKERLENDTDPLAKTFLAMGIDRKITKRNVMTYAYSSKKYGMASQQQTDLLDDLLVKTLRKEIPEHPFEQSKKMGAFKPTRPARYIASHIFEAIEQRINKPAQAMKFLQKIARALAHESKPVRWTTPTGIPWINRYHPFVMRRLQLWMHDKSVRVWVAVGHEPSIDKDRSANGVAPNFVHSLDAAHLQLVANRSVAAGIHNIATVHDSFGCLAPQAPEFNKIIREELVRMYEDHDVLAEILEQSRRDLTQHSWNKLPSVPEYGTLNLKEIRHALYAFSSLPEPPSDPVAIRTQQRA